MKGLTLSQKEQAGLETLNRVLEGQLRVNEPAIVLGVSERHAWRMLAAYRREGAAAVAHGNRGRRPANPTTEDIRQEVIDLARTRYTGVNHPHLTELLAE
jgi:transposase